ncbi:MAG: MBL fold metallo-hydrolase [Lachnospiraceae bacterium]|nr:MBL fold metallo-hydrolase [Lachnospiraceae bacterium]
MIKKAFAILISAALILTCVSSYAAQTSVARIGGNSFGTFESALDAASDGDTIVLLANVKLSSPLVIEKAVTITTVGGATDGVTISAAGGMLTGDLLDMQATVRIAGTESSPITITGKGSVSTTSCLLCIRGEGTELSHVIFRDNTVTRNSGAGVRSVARASFDHCQFTGFSNRDTIRSGAAVYTNSNAVFSDCVFSNSNAVYFGGGICVTGGATASFTRCGFNACTSEANGGAVYCASGTRVTLTDCTAENCSAADTGGVVYSGQGSVTAINCTFTNNTDGSGLGSCIRATGAISVTGCTFTGNTEIAVGINKGGTGLFERSITNCTFKCAPSQAHITASASGASISGCVYELEYPVVRDGYSSYTFDGAVLSPSEYLDGYFKEAMKLRILRDGVVTETVQLCGRYDVHITLSKDCYFDKAHTLNETDVSFVITAKDVKPAIYMQAEVSDTVTVVFSLVPQNNIRAAEYDAYESIALRVSIGANTDVYEIAGVKSEGSETWVFRMEGIRPQCMSDTIRGRFVGISVSGNETELGTTGDSARLTISEYCARVAELYPENTKLLALMADLLIYGASAQRYSSHNTSEPADNQTFVAESEVGYDMEAAEPEVTVPRASTMCYIHSAALVLNGKISPQLSFFIKDTTNVRVEISGAYGSTQIFLPDSDMEYKKGNIYSLTLDGMLPQDYEDFFTVSLYRGNSLLHSVKYSINCYLYGVSASGGTLGALASAAYNYGKAAAIYTGKKNVNVYTHENGELSIYFLNGTQDNGDPDSDDYVHSGDSTLLISPDGKTMLIDTNTGDPENNAVILNALSELEITTLDYLVFSHPHRDHIGGYKALFNAGIAVRQVYINDNFDYSSGSSGLVTYMANHSIPCNVLFEGDSFLFGNSISVEVFNPPADYAYNDNYTQVTNSGSLLMKFVYGDSSFLTGGDIYTAQENVIVAKYGSELDVDIVKMNHHGASTSNSAAWVTATSPLVAVSELDTVTSEEVWDRYRDAGSLALNVGIDGTVAVHTSGDGEYIVVTSRGRSAPSEMSFGLQSDVVPSGVTLR